MPTPDIDAPALAARLRNHAASVAWLDRSEIGRDLIAAADGLDRLAAERDAARTEAERFRAAEQITLSAAVSRAFAAALDDADAKPSPALRLAAERAKRFIQEPEPPGHDKMIRLEFNPTVSASSPVVRGTWVTAEQVVALIVEGWTWNDIKRNYHSLTDDDIRACLAYTQDADQCDAGRVRYADDDDIGG